MVCMPSIVLPIKDSGSYELTIHLLMEQKVTLCTIVLEYDQPLKSINCLYPILWSHK